ncbi:S-layer homology domain-containing protein [Paenibacillus sp. 2TAB26]|uniref:S-layer homology domain-containing protein n=1 Tax=Paenibacillus sp. 2TAB26 TaxID=3233005 RepID=UPI003F959EB1
MREKSNSLFKQNSQQPHVFRGGEIKVMKKKIAAFVLATALVLPLSVPAFAATPSDVVGKPVQSAVEELTALGIISGYEDGTFKPENSITRAELAKVVVIATGNESAAKLMNDVKPSFKDVKANAWYTGYINVASAKGFIQGFNGNYRPSDSVKFEEVVAILVRALGYQDKHLSGSWPYNVILQADNLNIFDGLEIATGTKANRGIVAELTSNTLGATLVGYDADGNQLDVDTKGKKLAANANLVPLINKLGTTEDKVLTGTSLTSKKEVSLNGANEVTADNFFVTGGKKLGELLGHSVSVLKKNGSNQILAITDAQAAGNIITTTSDANPAGTTVANAVYYNDGSVKNSAPGVVTYVNTDKQVSNYSLANDKEVVILLNSDDKVQALLVNNWDSNLVFEEVTAYKDYSRVTSKESGASYKVNSNTAISLDGKTAALADLKANDVVNVIKNADGDALNVVATRNTVSGKLDSIGKSGNDVTYTVGGKTYAVVANGLGGTIGTEYTYHLNKDGKIAYRSSVAGVDNSQFAVILNVEFNKSFIKDGEVLNGYTKVVYYSLKDAKSVTEYTKDVDVTEALKNTLVELKYTDGLINLPAAHGAVSLAAEQVVSEVTASKLTIENNSYGLNSNTIYLKASVNKSDSTKTTITVGTAADVTKGAKVAVKTDASGAAKYVVVTTAGTSANLPTVQGLFVKASENISATGSTYSVTLNVKGEEKTFALTNETGVDAYNKVKDLKKSDLVKLTDKADSGNALYEYADALAVATDANSLTVDNSTRVIVAGNATFVVSPETQIFYKKGDTVSVGSFADLREAVDGNNYNTKYTVVVQGSGLKYNGYDEAGVVVVKVK